MTAGHRHRILEVGRESLVFRFLSKPLWHTGNWGRVERSPYPYGVDQDGWCYLSMLSVLHRWTGLTLSTPLEDEEWMLP